MSALDEAVAVVGQRMAAGFEASGIDVDVVLSGQPVEVIEQAMSAQASQAGRAVLVGTDLDPDHIERVAGQRVSGHVLLLMRMPCEVWPGIVGSAYIEAVVVGIEYERRRCAKDPELKSAIVDDLCTAGEQCAQVLRDLIRAGQERGAKTAVLERDVQAWDEARANL